MHKKLTPFLIFVCLFFYSVVHAEIKTYEGFGEYYMSDFETPESAKKRAKARAEQNAQEQIGIFVQSYSKSIKSKLIEDEIIAMTFGLMKVLDVQYKSQPSPDGNFVIYQAIIKAQIDSEDFNQWTQQDLQKRNELITQTKKNQQSSADNNQKLEQLKQQFNESESNSDKNKIRLEIENIDNEFEAIMSLEEGCRLYYQKKYAEALSKIEKSIELNPSYATAYYSRGVLQYEEFQNLDKALSDYSKAIQLNPNYVDAYNNRGVVYNDLRYYTHAVEDCTKAIQINPSYVNSYINRSKSYYNLGEYRKGIEDCTKALAMDSSIPMAYNNRGACYNQLKVYDKAIADFNEALRLKSDFFEAYANRGNAYNNLKNYSNAINDCNSAIKINSNFAYAYLNRALAYIGMKQYRLALDDCTKTIELDANYSPTAYYLRSLLYAELGDKNKAQADFIKSKELGFRPQ